MIPTRSPVRESVTDDQSLCGRDHPQTGLDRQAADEQELVRPYWVMIEIHTEHGVFGEEESVRDYMMSMSGFITGK